MMHTIPLLELPGSHLLHDWLRGDPSLKAMFGVVQPDDAFAEQRSRQGASRTRLHALAAEGMRTLAITDAQRQTLDAIADQRSVMVVTGQQVGLFGGPLYTLLKIASAVHQARAWQEAWQRPVLPVFWLEDNDHDALEASTAHMFSAENSIVDVVAWNATEARIPVAGRVLLESDIDVINASLSSLTGAFADDVRAHIASCYTVGAAWTDAFLQFLQPVLGAWGVIVIRGSDVVRTGMHAPIVQRDLAHPGGMAAHVESATARLLAAGYHAQAQAAAHVFFMHDDAGRHRIIPTQDGTLQVGATTYSYDAVRAMAADAPERFSPSVLVRPIMQDAILPTVANILGPAELAYHAQLADAYAWYGVLQPAPILRHTATLLDARSERLLDKAGATAQYYMRPWDNVVRDVVSGLDDADMPARDSIGASATSLLAPWMTSATKIDATLKGSVESATAAVSKALEALDGKMRSALKRVHAESLDKHAGLATAIYPRGTMQERVLPVAHWWARFGVVHLLSMIDRIARQDARSHVVIGISDIQPPT